jgi:hypothetical protein
MGEERKVHKVLARKSEGKRPLGKPRHMWEDGIRMYLGQTGWGRVCGVDSIGAGCGDEPSGFGIT